MRDDVFFCVLRAAFGQPFGVVGEGMPAFTFEDLKSLFELARRQSLLGIAYVGLKKMSVALPRELALNWSLRAETIRGLNAQMDSTAARLTKLFEDAGCKSAILKGQANARLYPEPWARQPGDIDIWVSGGKKGVLETLKKMGLMEGAEVSNLYIHLSKEMFKLDVEVRIKPSSNINNPFADKRMQNFLVDEICKAEFIPEGFFAPSLNFAMIMQLSHIRKHLFGRGIGLRQLVDYFVLIQNSTDAEREAVSRLLKPMGLWNMAGAVMYVLGEVLGLDESKMLCKPDVRRGRVLLREVMEDGNFGSSSSRSKGSVYIWWLKNRFRILRFLSFDFGEVSWMLLKYWGKFVFLVPTRISILRHFLTLKNKKRQAKSSV